MDIHMSSPYKNKQWLYNRFVVQKRSIEEIAEEAQTTTMTIRNWLKEFNVTRSTR